MTPEHWEQLERLYHNALERAPEDRSAFLGEACAGNTELRGEVESLFACDGDTDGFLDSPPDDVVAGMMAEERIRSMIGRTLGHYRIHSLIGAGGMGEVYRARDTRLDREVAVKILPEHLAHDAEALRRFEREAKALAALSHPNILAIHDYGADQGVSYAVMELLRGGTLRDRLKRSAIDWREAVEIGIAIAEGLAAAHAREITHRDLKPENIFLTTSGQVKILDFGIARVKHVVSPESETLTSTLIEETRPGVVMGTLGYMSPEQVRGEAADAPSDIFSFGCVMYEMLSGRQPFVHRTAAETIAAILREEPPPLRQSAREIPAGTERIVRKALRKDRDDRYQTAEGLLSDLKGLRPENTTAIRPRPGIKLAAGIAISVVILSLAGVLAIELVTRKSAPASVQNPVRPVSIDASSAIVMRYFLEIESDGGAMTHATGFEPLDAQRKFRFHFIPRYRGYLYIIAQGENNIPTMFLTSQPMAETGVTTNLIEAGADYVFPSGPLGAGNGIVLGHYGTATAFTIIFSPSPLAKPLFLSSDASRQLTTDEQRELASFWQEFGKQAPALVPQTDGNQPGVAVNLPAERSGNQPLIFDITLKRR